MLINQKTKNIPIKLIRKKKKKQFLIGFLEPLGGTFILLLQVFHRFFKRPFEFSEVIEQMSYIGVTSIPIVAMTVFFSGAVIGLFTSMFLVQYGATSLAGSSVGLTVAREISPVLTGIMITARCGSSMTAHIGSMVITDQVDALKSLSVNPINYLVIPRFIACILMLPMLTLIGSYAGIFGGYIVAVSKGIPSSVFVEALRFSLAASDFIGAMYKALVFGTIIAVVSCYQGLHVSRSAGGVGLATTRTVVISMVTIYLTNYFLSDIIYLR